jgi:hypothetical protein
MRAISFGLLPLRATSFMQAQSPCDDLKQSLSAGFIYGVPFAAVSQSPAPGYSIGYAYRPLQWMAVEAGFNQIIHPIGIAICCEFGTNANDQLYLIPFGVKFLWSSAQGRTRLGIGAGGAYLNHHIGTQPSNGAIPNSSIFGAQAVASVDSAMTQSGRFRIGITTRYYYLKQNTQVTMRLFTIGPEFIFSAH